MTTITRPTPLEAAQRDLSPLAEEVARCHAAFIRARESARAARVALAEAEQRAEPARSRVATLRADAELRTAVGDRLVDAILAAELQVEVAETAFKEAQSERTRLYLDSSAASPDRADRARDLLPAAATHEAEAQTQLDYARGHLQSLTSQVDATLRRQRAQASERAFQETQGIRRGTERNAVQRFLARVAP